jgi:DNA-binding NarL/FixJ family response regulator
LRLGLERVLAETGFEVASHGTPFEPPRPFDVAVICERGCRDLAGACESADGVLAAGIVVLFRSPSPPLLLDCLAAGAGGFVAEHDGPRQLLAAISAVAAGAYHAAPGVLALLLDWHRAERRSRTERARAAERDLLRLLAAGEATAGIARRLGVAPKTVRNRSSLLYRRLGVHSRAQAVSAAEERGLLD